MAAPFGSGEVSIYGQIIETGLTGRVSAMLLNMKMLDSRHVGVEQSHVRGNGRGVSDFQNPDLESSTDKPVDLSHRTNARRGGLGRGLGALIPSPSDQDYAAAST